LHLIKNIKYITNNEKNKLLVGYFENDRKMQKEISSIQSKLKRAESNSDSAKSELSSAKSYKFMKKNYKDI
jgi:hypothetical protein